jgi:N6-L-threonylcarbamoyladenine synthase
MKSITVLGIETSCDETSAAIYTTAQGLVCQTLYSQISIHASVGGIIPEQASRPQLERITDIVASAIDKAHMTLEDIDVIAVTNTPGLPGSLLVGLNFAKAVAWATHKKLIGINHLEGHIFSAYLENPTIPFPHLCLTASGGHTALYWVTDFGVYHLLGQTLDDAAGEAFDKIAKLMGLGYPGGPIIETLAATVGNNDFFHYPRTNIHTFDFSFSGLKTAILYNLIKRGAYTMANKTFHTDDPALKAQVASSLQVCVGDIFVQKIARALTAYPTAQAITFVGGVSCNKYLKERIRDVANKHAILLYTPAGRYCTDNGAMIAFVGHYKAQRQEFSPWTLDIFE